MRKATLLSAIASVPFILAATVAGAQQFGTADEAKAMLARAVTEVKANEAAALEKFKKGEAGFKDRDLYVFCFDATSGNFTAHPTLVGTDVKTLKDKSGQVFGDKLFAAAQSETVSTVDYMWPKPGSTDPVQKQTFVTKVGTQGCAVGYYK